MKLFEFQAKNILKEYGVCIPRGIAISRSADASKTFQEIGCTRCVIKAQILAGGRGKSDGIQFASSPEEARHVLAVCHNGQLSAESEAGKGLRVIVSLPRKAQVKSI